MVICKEPFHVNAIVSLLATAIRANFTSLSTLIANSCRPKKGQQIVHCLGATPQTLDPKPNSDQCFTFDLSFRVGQLRFKSLGFEVQAKL